MAGEAEFHTGIVDPVAFACRLLRKAVRSGAQLVCTAPPAVLDELDRALWIFEEREFVPHVRLPGAAERVARRTPVWLMAVAGSAAETRVLVNLGGEAPVDARNCTRIIELVGASAEAAASARERWRAYKALGLAIRHHPQPDAAA